MKGGLAIALPWIAVATIVVLVVSGLRGGVDTNREKVNATAATTHDVDHALSKLREASERFCERVNDSRKDIRVVKSSLTTLVAVSLPLLPEGARDEFEDELAVLREPQPSLTCADFR